MNRSYFHVDTFRVCESMIKLEDMIQKFKV